MQTEITITPNRRPLAVIKANLPMAGLLLSVVLPMYFRGLFFLRDQAVAFALIGLFFVAYAAWAKLDLRTLATTRIEFSALALVGLYLITAPFAAQPRSALIELLKYLTYIMVFFAAARLPRDHRQKLTVLWAIFVGIAGTTVVALLAASGPWKYPGALMDFRLASTFQYPNAFGAVLGAGFVLALGLLELNEKRIHRALMGALASMMLMSFIYTYSRGALAILPFVIVGFIALLPKDRRAMAVARILAMVIAAAAGSPFMGRGLQKPDGLVWAGWFIALAVGLVLVYLLELPGSRRYLPALAIVLVIALAVGGVLLVSHLPKTLLDRLTSFSFGQRSFWERFAWDYDALKMMLASPLVGYGGGGWLAAYTRFQSYGYVTTMPHNGFMQTAVETGIPGFVALLAIWYFFIKALFPADREKVEVKDRLLLTTIVATGVMIGLHSAIDFDLSLGGISIILWTLFGLADGVGLQTALGEKHVWWAKGKSKRTSFYRRQVAWLLAGVIIFTLLGASFVAGDVLRGRALAEYSQGKADQAIAQMLLGTKIDPLNSALWTYAAQLKEQKQDYQAAFQLNKRAVMLDRWNPVIWAVQSRMAFKVGNGDAAISAAKRALSAQPQAPLQYETLADLYTTLGKYFYAQGSVQEVSQGKAMFQLVDPLAQLMHDRSVGNRFKNAPNALPPATAALEFYDGQSLLALGQQDQAVEHFRAAVTLADKTKDKALQAESYMWLGLGLQKTRTQSDPEAQAALRKAFDLDLTAVSKYTDALKWLK